MEALIKKKKKTGKLFSNWPLDKVQHNLKNVVVCREPVPGLTGAWILTRTQLQSHCTRMELKYHIEHLVYLRWQVFESPWLHFLVFDTM